MSRSQPPAMAFLNPNLNETGIKVASCVLPEIQRIILKFMIEDFLYFIYIDELDDTYDIDRDLYDIHIIREIRDRYSRDVDTLLFSDHTTKTCTNCIQAQILSMAGYDDLLDDIICTALEELDLTLKLKGSSEAPFIDEFINFVTSRSIKLKSVEMFPVSSKSVKEFTNPNRIKLLEFHSYEVSLYGSGFNQNIPTNYLSLKFVTVYSSFYAYLSNLFDSDLLNKLTSLTKLSVKVSGIDDLSEVEGVMERLQLVAPSLKHLYLNCEVFEHSAASCVDFLVPANTFIRKHKNLNIQFDVWFVNMSIQLYWRFDSKTQLSLPLHTAYPMDTKAVDAIEQWCSVPGFTALVAACRTPYSMLFPTNTEMIPFTRAINSTVSTVMLDDFSAEYEIVLEGFRSLKTLN
ncbi:unnamed protein product [Ambrosiozyma monospora]|uniref:Unnamed protein product n=1 Tax=Ambrosiozyma monospora TaxID=43982 RepID=A0A9W7DIN1_AMBMO|nr:unnamed protein product [Ambrosiozyma monospora]